MGEYGKLQNENWTAAELSFATCCNSNTMNDLVSEPEVGEVWKDFETYLLEFSIETNGETFWSTVENFRRNRHHMFTKWKSSLRALHVSWHFVDIQIIWRQNGKLNSKPAWNVLRKLVLTHPWHSSQSKPIFVTWKKHFRRKNNNSFPFPFGVLNVLIWEENLLLFVMKTRLQNFVLTKKKCDERWRAM